MLICLCEIPLLMTVAKLEYAQIHQHSLEFQYHILNVIVLLLSTFYHMTGS